MYPTYIYFVLKILNFKGNVIKTSNNPHFMTSQIFRIFLWICNRQEKYVIYNIIQKQMKDFIVFCRLQETPSTVVWIWMHVIITTIYCISGRTNGKMLFRNIMCVKKYDMCMYICMYVTILMPITSDVNINMHIIP